MSPDPPRGNLLCILEYGSYPQLDTSELYNLNLKQADYLNTKCDCLIRVFNVYHSKHSKTGPWFV